ncbi:fructose 1,6-bisphosphatase [Paramagnetospirillum marisnigri]|uniref:Fructose-1,6-bisphosphatase n=1 Tax=Paramagnetospirillum marisnigri TaxID=1285242 RepID=A0A178MTK7_9PROT|nr:class II fructose-bisphosphatase [Paramagnetospirillum marisnigri]OAN52136.1 fructose 1,6-bisphosphatase [Paramagnetospirillum marisnigri]
MSDPKAVTDRNLALEVVRVTEASALAAARHAGRGDEKAADEAACGAMRRALNRLSMDGVIVNGEGDDEGQPLHTGERVGNGCGPKVDIVLTALEGRSICARGAHNALSVVALTEEGSFLKVPQHSYMEKIAVGPGIPDGVIDLDLSPEDNLARIAEAKGGSVADLTVSILDRPRHSDLIERLYATGARVMLFDDGDVSGALAAGLEETGVDVYLGSGGAAQGVLAAAGLKCLGGRMQCRLLIRSEGEFMAARNAGLGDPKRKWDLDEMVKGEVMFAATGITDGHVLKGARLLAGNRATSHSLVMRSVTGTIRYMTARHDLDRSPPLI